MVKNKGKVLIALSGGVDSSVAAALLVKEGYDVTAMYAVNYDDSTDPFTGRNIVQPCWRSDYQDALRVAAKLGISLLRWDFQKEYKKDVLDYMYAEYSAGHTPNPDVLCNKFVKFGAWLDKAKKFGFDYIATGHYANISSIPYRISRNKNVISVTRYALRESKDTNKDQTYFLHQLNQEQLAHTLFPIGGYTKPEVRELAKKFDLPTAKKEESMGICFIGEVPMKEFLQKEIKSKPGQIILSDGKVVGQHEGLPFFTIGERVKVDLPISKPFFVVDKDSETNTIIVGSEDDPLMFKKEITVGDINWISGFPPKLPLKCLVRLRHRQPLQKCIVIPTDPPIVGERRNPLAVVVKFSSPQRAVTPGQFAVFYTPFRSSVRAKTAGKRLQGVALAKTCLGGGEIV